MVSSQCEDYLFVGINSLTRAIDQICIMLAPLAAGQVMTFISLRAGAGVMAGWNLITIFVQYILLFTVYKAVPRLANKTEGIENQILSINALPLINHI